MQYQIYIFSKYTEKMIVDIVKYNNKNDFQGKNFNKHK
jgi:hypothetical protein